MRAMETLSTAGAFDWIRATIVVTLSLISLAADSVGFYRFGKQSCQHLESAQQSGGVAFRGVLACAGDKRSCGEKLRWYSYGSAFLKMRVRYVSEDPRCAFRFHVYEDGVELKPTEYIGGEGHDLEYDIVNLSNSNSKIMSLYIEPEAADQGCPNHGILRRWHGVFHIWNS
jgi:hypothetical protein